MLRKLSEYPENAEILRASQSIEFFGFFYRVIVSKKYSFTLSLTALITSLSVCEIVYCLIDLGLDISVIVGRKEMAFTLYFIVCCVMIPVQYCIMLLITGRKYLLT